MKVRFSERLSFPQTPRVPRHQPLYRHCKPQCLYDCVSLTLLIACQLRDILLVSYFGTVHSLSFFLIFYSVFSSPDDTPANLYKQEIISLGTHRLPACAYRPLRCNWSILFKQAGKPAHLRRPNPVAVAYGFCKCAFFVFRKIKDALASFQRNINALLS